MGIEPNIKHNLFPKQGAWAGKRVEVCFHYDTKNTVYGKLVRDDKEAPGVGIVKLDDGRYVLTTECQYSFLPEEEETCAHENTEHQDIRFNVCLDCDELLEGV